MESERCRHCSHELRADRLFCPGCGRAQDPSELRSISFNGFLGNASLSPRMERWHATGDPDYTAPESEFPTPLLDARNADLLSIKDD